MPRDANGNYTLPAGNPVVSGTTIDTSWANPTMFDLGNEITNSLSRTGEGGMLVPFKNQDGAVGTPGMTWTNETITGFYRAGTNDMRVSVGGTDKFRWTFTGVEVWNSVDLVWESVLVDGDLPPAGVETFNTRLGDVTQTWFGRNDAELVATAGDYVAAQVNTAPFSSLTATEVQTALEQLEAIVEGLSSGIVLQGMWDAATNDPDLLVIAKFSGNYWIVEVAGTTPLPDGEGGFIDSWAVGDRALYINQTTPNVFDGWVKIVTPDTIPATNVTFNSSIYDDYFAAPFPTTVQAALDAGWPLLALAETSLQPGDNVSELVNDAGYLVAASAVLSFDGRTGVVVPADADYNAGLITYNNVPSGLAALRVQPAIDELSASIDTINADTYVNSFNARTGDVLPVAGDYTAIEVDYDNALTPAWGVTEVQSALVDAYDAIQFLAGAIVLKGLWDALGNVPDIGNVAYPKTSGNYWIVSVEGSTVLPKYPDAPAFLLPYEVNDRILWLDDGAGITGFAQLRPSVSEFLLLTGGSMLGQIVGVSPGPVAAGDLTRKDYVDSAIAGIPLGDYLPLIGGTVTGQIKGINPVNIQDLTRKDYVDTAIGNIPTNFLPLTGGTVTGQIKGINPINIQDLTRKDYVDTAIGNIPTNFLPLTGGTLTADNEALIVKAATLSANVYQTFRDSDGSEFGLVGKTSAGMVVRASEAHTLVLESTTAVNITAPTTNVNGKQVITTNDRALTIQPTAVNFATFLQIKAHDGTDLGYVGKGVNGTDDMHLASQFANLHISAASGTIVLTPSPAGSINLDGTVNIDGSQIVPSKAGYEATLTSGETRAVVFANPLPDANYAVALTLEGGSNLAAATFSARTATGFNIRNNAGTTENIAWIVTPYNS